MKMASARENKEPKTLKEAREQYESNMKACAFWANLHMSKNPYQYIESYEKQQKALLTKTKANL